MPDNEMTRSKQGVLSLQAINIKNPASSYIMTA